MSRIEWRTNWQANGELEQAVRDKLLTTAARMVAEIKRSMRGYGQYSDIATRETVKGKRRTKKGKRHYPSPPGSPPAVDTGRLRASISFNWSGSGQAASGAANAADGVSEPVASPGKLVVVVGTNVEYGPYLELGAPKANLAPRPYLRPVLEKYRSQQNWG